MSDMPREIFITEINGSSNSRQGMWMEETFKNPLNDIEYGEHYTRTSETIDSLLERVPKNCHYKLDYDINRDEFSFWVCHLKGGSFRAKTPAEAIKAALLSLEGEEG